MIVSHADRYRRSFFRGLIAASICALSGPGLAQQAGPSDTPPAVEERAAEPGRTNAPIRLGPRRLIQPAAPRDGTGGDPARRQGDVDIRTLESVDADSVGALGDLDGGLGAGMWRGADRALVVRLLALMPKNIPSPAMRDLARRLLLTRAEAPRRTAPGPGILPLRINALFAMGDYDSALALLAAAPPGDPDEQLLRIRAEILFHRHDVKSACALVRGDAQELKGAYWQQAQAYCLAVAGKNAEAVLLSDILAERAQTVDPAFFTGMDALAGTTPVPPDSFKNFSALLNSLLRTGNVPLPQTLPGQIAAADLAAIAQSPNAPLPLRLSSGEIAALNGALKPSDLADIYRVEKFDAEALSKAVSGSGTEWGTNARAQLIQAAMAQSVPAARAEALQRAIELARAQGDLPLTAQAVSYPLRGIRPAPELSWFAASAVRGLIAAGAIDTAIEWLRLSQRQTQSGREESLWHLAVLAGVFPPGSVNDEALGRWHEAFRTARPERFADQAKIFFGLLQTLGTAVPGRLWSDVIDAEQPRQGTVPPPAVRALLRSASAAGRIGETVALSLVMMGDEGPGPANLVAVERVVAALHAVGLTDAARQIALEAAVAAGL